MCGGGSFGLYPVSFKIDELKDRRQGNRHARAILREIGKKTRIREAQVDGELGKITLLCVAGQVDREGLRDRICQMGYTVR